MHCHKSGVQALIATELTFVQLHVMGAQNLSGSQTPEDSPLPTAPPTSNLPSGRSGGSAAGLPTLPFTLPCASEMTWMPPRMPSPLNVTCTPAHQTTWLCDMLECA